MSELDTYRDSLATKGLGDLINELLDLRLADPPEGAKQRILHVQKQREVVLQINRREVVEDGKVTESRDTKVRSLKNIF